MQDGVDVLSKDVAKVDDTVAIEATGHHRAVGEDAELILEPVAEEPVALDFCLFVGPLKALSPLKIDAVADSGSSVAFLPVTGDLSLQMGDGGLISVVVKALVPKAEHHDHRANIGSLFGEVCEVADVSLMRVVTALLKAMQGNVHLVHAGGQEFLAASREECAVGGDDGLVPPLACHANEFGEAWVRQRLTQEVVVKILCLIGQLLENVCKLLCAHAPRRATVPVTTGAIHVAPVCDLDVNLVVHDGSFLTVFA